jgi:hypothetical protein
MAVTKRRTAVVKYEMQKVLVVKGHLYLHSV